MLALCSEDLLHVGKVLATEKHHLEHGQRFSVPNHDLPVAKVDAPAPRACCFIEWSNRQEDVYVHCGKLHTTETMLAKRLGCLGRGEFTTYVL